jgi:hypothetical protein
VLDPRKATTEFVASRPSVTPLRSDVLWLTVLVILPFTSPSHSSWYNSATKNFNRNARSLPFTTKYLQRLEEKTLIKEKDKGEPEKENGDKETKT